MSCPILGGIGERTQSLIPGLEGKNLGILLPLCLQSRESKYIYKRRCGSILMGGRKKRMKVDILLLFWAFDEMNPDY